MTRINNNNNNIIYYAIALLMAIAIVFVTTFVVVNNNTAVSTTTNGNQPSQPSTQLFCRIQHTDVLMMVPNDSNEDSNTLVDHGITECYPTTASSSTISSSGDNSDIPLVHEIILLPPPSSFISSLSSFVSSFFSWSIKGSSNDESESKYEIHHNMIHQYLNYDINWIDTTSSNTNQIHIPYHIHSSSKSNDNDVSILQQQYIYDMNHPIIQNHLQQQLQLEQNDNDQEQVNHQYYHHHRHLERIITDQNRNIMLAVRVSTNDENVTTSIEDIENYLFNNETSFTNIHNLCTIQQKNIIPYNNNIPVYDIVLNGNSKEYTFGSFFTAAEPIIASLIFNNNDDMESSSNTTSSTNTTTDEPEPTVVQTLSDIAEYVLLIGPKGLRPTTQQPNFRFVAAGSYNSYKVVVTDDWIDTPQVIQHEIGHNYNFGHPWEDNVIYGDTTSVMGQVYRNTIFNCYNGVHYDYAGWMKDTTLTIDLSENATSQLMIMTDLAFYGHIDRLDTSITIDDDDFIPTLIVMNGFYIMYNRATGINAETNEYANGILLHRYKEFNVSQTGTDLIAVLELSDNTDDINDRTIFRNSEFDIMIELCSQNDSMNDNEPDTVTLILGTASSSTGIVCPDIASDVPSSSPVPTISPVPSVTSNVLSSEMPSDVPTEMPNTDMNRRRNRNRNRRTTRRQF